MDKYFDEEKIVFREPDKDYIHPNAIYHFMKRHLKKLNLPKDLTIHSTRHTSATMLIRNNVPLPDIQQFGGWASSKVLLDTYSHADLERQGTLVKSLSSLTEIS